MEVLESFKPKIDLNANLKHTRNALNWQQKKKFEKHISKRMKNTTDKVVKKIVRYTKDTDILEAIKTINNKGIKEGTFPDWIQSLIDHDANPVDMETDDDFCKLYNTSSLTLFKVRKIYPNYAMVVALRRKYFLADLGNVAMTILVKRMQYSDAALKIALEMSGQYIPITKSHSIDEEIPRELKEKRILAILERVKASNECNRQITDQSQRTV